jgi:hypothetical protein
MSLSSRDVVYIRNASCNKKYSNRIESKGFSGKKCREEIVDSSYGKAADKPHQPKQIKPWGAGRKGSWPETSLLICRQLLDPSEKRQSRIAGSPTSQVSINCKGEESLSGAILGLHIKSSQTWTARHRGVLQERLG